MRTIGITETLLRDAQQSQIATRMPFEDFAPILKTMNEVGYYSIECWGGATFDTCLRYLHEDPWERLRKIREAVPDTKLQMLLRGQNVLGYRPYPDDVVEKFVELSIKNGIDIIRIFDALNDVRNLEVAVRATKKYGGIAAGTVCFTSSPVHTPEAYLTLAKQLRDMGCDSICIKDMAGIMGPQEAYDLVTAIKSEVDLPLAIHTHCTTGLAPFTLLKSIEAGADIIDTAVSVLAGGTSQYPTESAAYALRQLGYNITIDDAKARAVNEHFIPLQKKYIESGLLDPYCMSTRPKALVYQIPGGMLSNLIAQLKAQNAMDRFDEVLLEVPNVRRDLGYPPLVTPTSQMTGVQAVINVLAGDRYRMITSEVKSYLRGEYGHAPGPVDPDLLRRAIGGQEPIKGRYADTLEPLFEKTKAELGSKAKSDEDVLSYIAFPQLAEEYFAWREANAK
jgi:oxaloacetate decarboxylase alpha subunit